MPRAMKESIMCVDCGAERKVTKACLKLVKRCKPCQVIFNRDSARNRYRELHNIPPDKPVRKPRKKKKEVKVESDWLKPTIKSEAPPAPKLSPEEEAARKARVEKLFELFDDGSTDDDW